REGCSDTKIVVLPRFRHRTSTLQPTETSGQEGLSDPLRAFLFLAAVPCRNILGAMILRECIGEFTQWLGGEVKWQSDLFFQLLFCCWLTLADMQVHLKHGRNTIARLWKCV